MQTQANVSEIPVAVPQMTEVTALGAAFLAGLGVDFWRGLSDLPKLQRPKVYRPVMDNDERTRLLDEWKRAVHRARNWVREAS